MPTIAELMAKKRREISISEFFERNKQILGFDSLTRALLTCVKECVDNSLDACEEAGILPEITVEVSPLQERDRYRISVEDNGPGIVKRQVPMVFAKLLYGSRFHAVRQARGQQGIGVSACVLYAQLTTGLPTRVATKVAEKDYATIMELMIDTRTNRPMKVREDVELWERPSGTRVELSVKGRYQRSRQSPYEYLKETAIVNPHARIVLVEPNGTRTVFERASEELPRPTTEVKPHPYGIEVGTFMRMVKETKARTILSFLSSDFSRVSYRVAREVCRRADVPEDTKVRSITLDQAKRIVDAFSRVKIMAPETDCLSPIGAPLIKKGLRNVLGSLRPEVYLQPETREPKVYAGHPFLVEVGIVYGGDLPRDSPIQILRFANRVPLLYEQGSCVMTAAVSSMDWRRYGLEQRGGHGIPVGPAVVLVHVASTKLPFTSEAKVSISDVDEIRAEVGLALRACARRLRRHLVKKARREQSTEKFTIVREVLPMMAEMCARVLGKKVPSIDRSMTRIMNIVLVEDQVEFRDGIHQIKVDVYNYRPKSQKLKLHLILPGEGEPTFVSPEPSRVNGTQVEYDMRLRPVESVSIRVDLNGIPRDEYTENEVYVSGVDPGFIVGAEPPSGEWEVETLRMEVLPVAGEGEDGVEVDDITGDLGGGEGESVPARYPGGEGP